MSEKIVQLNEEVIKGQLKEMVRGSVEETLNELLEQEAEKLTQAARYERNETRQGYRSGHYDRNLTTTSGDITLHMPRLKGMSFETAIIERYRRRESSVEEALIEMYLAGVSVRRVEDITEALWGSKVSPATISELNKKAYVHIEDWRNRPLQGGHYPYVYVDGIYLRRNWGVVMRPCRGGKRLLHTALLQERCKCCRGILLAAVAVKSQISGVTSFTEGCPKCAGDQICTGVAGYAIANDFPGKEVEDDAQIKPVIVDLKVCNIADPCLIRTICGELLLQQVLLAVFLILLKLLFGIDTNAAQVELLHDRGNALGADSDATFGQCDANLFGAIPLTTIIKSLPHQMHKLRLLLVALVAVCTAKDMVVKCTASDIQCLA